MLRAFIDDAGHAMFGVIAIIMKAAPLGAFGAMAYTVAKYGSASLVSLAWSPDEKIVACGSQDCSVHFWRR